MVDLVKLCKFNIKIKSISKYVISILCLYKFGNVVINVLVLDDILIVIVSM